MNKNSQPQVVILGQGALGRTLVYLLQESGHTPELYSRSSHGPCSFEVQDNATSSVCSVDIQSIETLLEQKPSKQRRLLFMCYKALDCIIQSEKLCDTIQSSDIVVLLSNGIGVYEQCHDKLPPCTLLRMAVNFGMYIPSPDKLVLSGSPAFSFVRSNSESEADRLLRALLASHPATEYTDIITLEWNKAAINYVVNSLCTLCRSTNKAVLSEPLAIVAEALYDEFCTIAQKEGICLQHTEYPPLASSIRDYKDNTNSTLQDVLKNQSTELPFLMGPVLEAAQIHGVTIPISSLVYTLLYTLEQNSLTKESI